MYKLFSAIAVMVALSSTSFSASSAVLRDNNSGENGNGGVSQQSQSANSAPQASSQPFSGGEIVSGEWSGGGSGSSSFGGSNGGVGGGSGGSTSPSSNNGGFSLADLLVYFDGVPYIALPDLQELLGFLLDTLNNGGSFDGLNPGTPGSGNGSAPVPLPGPVLLFGSALLGLFGYQRAAKK